MLEGDLMSDKLYPIILCGGSGTRLWPMSRKTYPKQFVSMFGGETLLQAAVERFSTPEFHAPILLSNNEFRFLVGDQLAQIKTPKFKIIIEPFMRNTAPAIAAAALILAKEDPTGVMLVAPSDHIIKDPKSFLDAVKFGIKYAKQGKFITFGIFPTRPETGFGYVKLSTAPNMAKIEAIPFECFVEKPSRLDAEEMISSGKYLWNSGIFMFSVQAVLDAFKVHSPDLLSWVTKAVDGGMSDLDFFRLSDDYTHADDISFEYAIMENISGVTIPISSGWNDLGNWKTVWQEADKDKNGVVSDNKTLAVECENSLLQSHGDEIQIIAIGLKNIVAVAMRDAVLIADIGKVQLVKQAVEDLKRLKIPQAEEFPKSHRPWGWYEKLALGDRFQVKNIMVKPGGKLSLQSHLHRAEHWVVVEGIARVTVDDRIELLSENQSIYIPIGAVHRLENPGKIALHLIEVQTGSYLAEDDIIRYEDIYKRD